MFPLAEALKGITMIRLQLMNLKLLITLQIEKQEMEESS